MRRSSPRPHGRPFAARSSACSSAPRSASGSASSWPNGAGSRTPRTRISWRRRSFRPWRSHPSSSERSGYRRSPRSSSPPTCRSSRSSLGTIKGLKSTPAPALELMRTYHSGRWQQFRKLRLPAALPFFFAGLKVAARSRSSARSSSSWRAPRMGSARSCSRRSTTAAHATPTSSGRPCSSRSRWGSSSRPLPRAAGTPRGPVAARVPEAVK